ncbi:Ff.00g006330.m01.CDS01 [Fusarium sp. VM40]|nr:Ff.00g006330.m01.CDS01 [Fusarium sp. VM40]
MQPQKVFIFGDQSVPILDALQTTLLIRDNAILKQYLDEAFLALRREISTLPAQERSSFSQAETLGLVLEDVRKGQHGAALDSALLCLYEIAYYIELISKRGLQHPPESTSFLGICTGSFAAAAISCSKTLFDLISSFPLLSRPYIGAVGPNTVTISGPPDVLQQFLTSEFPSTKKAFPIPIHGPYHYSQGYKESDLESIFDTVLEGVQNLDRDVKISNISCSSGSVMEKSTYEELLKECISGVLTQQIRLDKVTAGLSNLLSDSGDNIFIPINTQIAQSLSASVERSGKIVRVDNTPLLSISPNPPGSVSDTDRDSSQIAIIGFSGRFPEADTLGEFWDLLEQGLDVSKPVPADRFDGEKHYDPTGQRKNTNRVTSGCWLKGPGLFDARFFRMSPREACQADPAQRLALLTAYEALEMAGIVPDRTASTQRHRVGVFYGTTSDDWREVNSGQDIDTYFIPGGNRAFIPGRINYFFKFSGPSISVDTACSSSLAAINLAITSLLERNCDTAIAGGTNVMTNPDNFAGLDRGHFLCKEGNCKTFDDLADGYCRAEGVGTVILKRLPDAIADGDPVFGVIRGAHTNHSAEAVSITRPLADAQEYLFKKLLNESGVKPHDVSYIEMHGTGTQAGDAVEMKSVINTFASDYSRRPDQTLHLGSVKSNTGHGESASGVTALIKVLLMMQKSRIPPHCGIKGTINHGFPLDLDRRGIRIAMDEAEWLRPANSKRRTFVNNFSAAGGNTALLLEDAPISSQVQGVDARKTHVVTISARSVQSFKRNLLAMADFVGDSTSFETLTQLSYTTTARRMHHNYRAAFATTGMQDLKRSLLAMATEEVTKPVPSKLPGIGFLFTGQGAQCSAMGRELYLHISSFRSDIDSFDCIARTHSLPSILPLVDGSVEIEELSPAVIQVGTCIIQIALSRLWANLGMKPAYVLGHSLGEYAALCIAGVLSISDTIYLCGWRATLIESGCTADTHGMLAVKASKDHIRQVLATNPLVEIACVNGPEDIVLSGPNADIDAICLELGSLGLKFTRLPVPFAFHSSQVDPVLYELQAIAQHVSFKPATLPIISTLSATVIQPGETIGPEYIRKHCREPVEFLAAVQMAQQDNIINSSSIFVEIGAHPILSRMVKSISGSETRCFPSLRRNEEPLKTLAESLRTLYLAGVAINWDSWHRDFPSCQRVLDLPNYSWDLEKYWIQYEGDWCLTKGSPVVAIPPTPAMKSTRLSDSVHEIVEQDVSAQRSQDHQVNGLILCPSSLYADIAYTLGKYAIELRGSEGNGYVPDVCNMLVEKALIVQTANAQFIRASLSVDWKLLQGDMELYSVDSQGKQTTRHATCNIRFQLPEVWQQDWRRNKYLIQRSIKNLLQGLEEETTHRVRRGMAYKMFSSVVKYGPGYQGMQEVVFDSEGLEATAKVRLQPVEGGFVLNPFWCDSFGHLTGFVMHSNDVLDLSEHAYINQGWQFMRCAETFSADAEYRTYVKMQRVGKDDSSYSGDVYVFREGDIIAMYGGVTFNRVSKRVLDMLLPSPNKLATTRSKPTPPPVKQSSRPSVPEVPARSTQGPHSVSIFEQALEIICREIGVDRSKLSEDSEFANYGVDSLMSLTILGNFRESLNMDVQSLFDDYPSVKPLRQFLSDSPMSRDETVDDSPSSNESGTTEATTPTVSEENAESLKVDSVDGSIHLLLTIIADEIGISIKELARADDLAELGVDSLVSLTILGRAREELDIDLPQDLFLNYSSLSGLTTAIGEILGPRFAKTSIPLSHPQATSVMLQGRAGSPHSLFLFPDGSGSSTSYVGLPPVSPDLCVYGLDCPYVRNPKDLKCDLTASYIAEIRRRQPNGPYSLAGWSAGGIAAYDAAQHLVNQGETVQHLILIDSPNPIGLEKLPPRFYKFLEKSGVFGAGDGKAQSAPEWLIQHFLAFIDALDKYKPVPFKGPVPKTTLIWATDGVCKNPTDVRPEPQDDDPKEMTWLLENRANLGPNGWNQLLGEDKLAIFCIEEANHFTMVRKPNARKLVDIIRTSLDL